MAKVAGALRVIFCPSSECNPLTEWIALFCQSRMKKVFNWIAVLGLSAALWSGCKTTPPTKTTAKSAAKHAVESAAASPQSENSTDAEETAADPTPILGNPEALAHFAAGVSYQLSDQSDSALEQFYQSALSDPGNEPLVVELSRRFLAKKQTQKAIDLLSKSAKRPQASGFVFNMLAHAYLKMGNTNSAIHASRTGIQKSPDALESYQTLADIFLQIHQPAESLKVLNQAARHAKNEAAFLVNLAELYAAYLTAQPKERAAIKPRILELLHRAADLKPQSERVLARMADAFSREGEPKRAKEIYLKLLAGDLEPSPSLNVMRQKLANIYLQDDDKKHAAEQFEEIVRDNPTRYPQVWFFLGTIAYEEKKFSAAAGDFEKALGIDPDIEQAYYDLAMSQIDLHKTDEALQTLGKARGKFQNSFAAEFFSGMAYSRLKDFSEAVKHFTAAEVIARATQPKQLNHQFYFQLGAASERNHDYKQAEEYFQKCLKESPDFTEALNYLGYMWAERGENLEKARELIGKAVKLDPKNGAFLDSMGWVLFKLKQPQEALTYLLKAQEFSPEPDPTLLDHLGDVYMALHQADKAREAWKKSLSIEPNEEIKKKLDLAGGNS